MRSMTIEQWEARPNFPPLSPDDPLVRTGDPCPICGMPFSGGDVVELVRLGPDLADREAVRAARDGEAHSVRAVAVHIACRPPGATENT